MATAISGAIGGLPIITVIVRSTVNINNHAKTKWSNFYHGLLIIIFLFVLAPIIQMIPLAALASILVYIGYRLASPTVFKKIYSMGMEQLIFMLTTIAITLYSDLLMGILFGSLFTLLVHALLSRMPAQDFFKALFKSDTKLNERNKNNYDLDMRGIANFLSIPKVEKLLSIVPDTASVNINLNNTRLVGTTFMEFIVEFLRSHEEKGGRVTISGLEDHVSSSPHNRALKISLTNREVKLSPRQKKLTDFAKANGYKFVSNVDWNTSYLRNFHFFETRPIERKDNCLRGKFEEVGMDWEIADVTFNEGAAFTAEIFHATVMTLKIDREIPKFTMEKEGVLDKLFDRVMALSGYKDIDFEMYTHFSKKFLIMGENESAIRSFFTHELISFFEGEQVFHIESNGEALLIFNKLKLTRTDETLKIMNFAEKLAKRIRH
jgi:hypothetical protein